MLEVSVGDPDAWSSEQHPLRMDASCPVRYVPTLIHWVAGNGPGSRLEYVLSSDESEETVRLAVAKFLKETAQGRR